MNCDILDILTHLAYTANAKKMCYIKNNVTVLKGCGKPALADVSCYRKMTSFVALDGVMSFLCLKDVTNTCKLIRHSPTIGGN